jgi:hypothetical protein
VAVIGAGFAFVKPNSDAMSSGNTPEKRIEKKLLNDAESRDKTTSATQDINRSVVGTPVNVRLGETNAFMLVSSK